LKRGSKMNQQIATKALCELKKHHGIMDQFFKSVSGPLQIRKKGLTKENLWKILLIDIQSRGGPKLNGSAVKRVKTAFFRNVDLGKAKSLKGEDKFNYLYSTLIGLPKIGPKIAAVFMKNMVCEFSIFAELRNYLFVPIDLHVEKILTKKLRAFTPKEPSRESPLKSKKSRLFQNELSKICNPRIELDGFWYVGYLFCNKKSELVCKELCWIRRYCHQKVMA
jgi:hypothetical protein